MRIPLIYPTTGLHHMDASSCNNGDANHALTKLRMRIHGVHDGASRSLSVRLVVGRWLHACNAPSFPAAQRSLQIRNTRPPLLFVPSPPSLARVHRR